jgi:endonuclease/exonuclease/phosphatase (EEP) superfamily protein YafD
MDHREFRELLGTGLTDAAEAAGKALTPTWPVNSPVPPFVALDHVLVSGDITVAGFERVLVPGSDHAAVVARLVLP